MRSLLPRVRVLLLSFALLAAAYCAVVMLMPHGVFAQDCEGCGSNFDSESGSTPTGSGDSNYWGASAPPGPGYTWSYASGVTLCEGCGPVGSWVATGGDGGSSDYQPSVVLSSGVDPTCAITVDRSPIPQGGATTLRWTSEKATLFYIHGIGYVGSSGSARVSPSQTTQYAGYVTSGAQLGAEGETLGYCSATLVVGGGGGGGGGACTASSMSCRADGNLANNCGEVTVCPFGCSTLTNQCNASCTLQRACDVTGTYVINACNSQVIENCTARGAGWRCVAGACQVAPVSFASFTGQRNGQAFAADGHLRAAPTLLAPGNTSRLYWNATNAASCTVRGSNGDGAPGSATGAWNMDFSGAGGVATSPITAKTTYTLTCQAYPGATPATVQESVEVNIVPVFRET